MHSQCLLIVLFISSMILARPCFPSFQCGTDNPEELPYCSSGQDQFDHSTNHRQPSYFSLEPRKRKEFLPQQPFSDDQSAETNYSTGNYNERSSWYAEPLPLGNRQTTPQPLVAPKSNFHGEADDQYENYEDQDRETKFNEASAWRQPKDWIHHDSFNIADAFGVNLDDVRKAKRLHDPAANEAYL